MDSLKRTKGEKVTNLEKMAGLDPSEGTASEDALWAKIKEQQRVMELMADGLKLRRMSLNLFITGYGGITTEATEHLMELKDKNDKALSEYNKMKGSE